MDEDQLERFGEAVERKKQEAKEASEQPHQENPAGTDVGGDQPDLTAASRPQDTRDIRDKNSGKGKKTADKWNQ